MQSFEAAGETPTQASCLTAMSFLFVWYATGSANVSTQRCLHILGGLAMANLAASMFRLVATSRELRIATPGHPPSALTLLFLSRLLHHKVFGNERIVTLHHREYQDMPLLRIQRNGSCRSGPL